MLGTAVQQEAALTAGELFHVWTGNMAAFVLGFRVPWHYERFHPGTDKKNQIRVYIIQHS